MILETGEKSSRVWFRILPGLRSLVEDVSSVAGSNSYTVLRKDPLDLTVIVVNSVSRSCLAYRFAMTCRFLDHLECDTR